MPVFLEKNILYINSPFLLIILILLIALICFVLVMLYYRFIHFGKRVRFPLPPPGKEGRPGQEYWEGQMLELAESHSQVRLTSYSYVLDDYNQVAYKRLNKIRDSISALSTDIISLIPAARWLFDNFQMMYREIKKVRTSGNSYAVLPILKAKEHRGFPRIYVMAKRMVTLSGGHLTKENISIMLKAYQQKIPLTDKEIWVLPEMLGFCLLEEIIMVSDKILQMIDVKTKAYQFVHEMDGRKRGPGRHGRSRRQEQQGLYSDYSDLSALLKELPRELEQNYSFHAHVVYLLRNRSFPEAAIQKYIEYHFPGKGRQLKASGIFLEEGRIESLLETNIRTLIVSLRDISEVDEEKFFEEYSCLERILSQDPDGIYPKMDSEARGMYRGVIVKLSLRYQISEEKIASDCLELATQGKEDLHCPHHVGTYLLGKGYPVLKAKALGKSMPKRIKTRKNIKGYAYFTVLFLIVLLIGAGLVYGTGLRENITAVYPYVFALLFGMPLFIGISQEVTNFIFTRRITVKKIPSLDYEKGIPDEARTFVVMPVIVSSVTQGLEYMERLHKQYLANRQSNLYFALLLDFEDSPDLILPKDGVIEGALAARMKELNGLYPSEHQRFSLFLRCRIWNKAENCYMGWERKRGKLEEFNNLLTGTRKEDTSFSSVFCDEELLTTFRYVITLDADTNLIRDNAAKLVGLIDHPLNRPLLDRQGKTLKNQQGKPLQDQQGLAVQEGYAIIQPSVRNHIVDKSGSRFSRIFGGDSGLAHYNAVISDIYQDIFHEGIYTGKGIYDIDAFHKVLQGKVPENSILSHDLFESCYARTAFSSTAKIMDSFPNSVLSFTKREHRWMRGDWQLLPWLFMKKTKDGHGLCALAKWKVFDNLRRSLVPISKTLLLFVNLVWFPRGWYLWLVLVFFSDAFNLIVLLCSVIIQKLLRPKLALVYKSFFREIGMMSARALLEFTITPYRAYVAGDAIIRTLYRVFVSKKNLLQWNTAEAVDGSVKNTRKGYFLAMWSSLLAALALAAVLSVKLFPSDQPKAVSGVVETAPAGEVTPARETAPAGGLPLAGILLTVVVIFDWGAAFDIAYRISQPKKPCRREEEPDSVLLLETARRTWQFFRELSTKENNWLCPDNYQVSQAEKVSDKTSPTNIGLQFLAILSAGDFGFETLSSTLQSLGDLMDTICKMPKWKGHLYNWYHIKTLEVLSPAYISTVDSGNFFGHLLVVKNGLLDMADRPIYPDGLSNELKNKMDQSEKELQAHGLKAGLLNTEEKESHGYAVGYRSIRKQDENEYESGYKSVGELKLKENYETIGELMEDLRDIWEGLDNMELEPASEFRHTRDLMRFIDNISKEVSDLKLKEESFASRPTLRKLAEGSNKHAIHRMNQIRTLAARIDCLLANADFSFLFNEKRMLFHIGYHVSSHMLDEGCYDLMASECALTSLLAIAKGEIPFKHWYKLGRPLTIVKGIPCFVSWSGTMFEFLMPNLVFKEYEGSVYAQTSRAAVLCHISYAKEAGIPWGISESQYYRFDLNSNYQYRAFGVPKIRLQPVRRNSLVVAPYATMLALDVAGDECLRNLRRLRDLGAFGDFGFYEAIDFNVPNAVEMTPFCIVRSYMAHHQGMTLAAINNYLNDGILRERFHAETMIKATEVLLEEKRESHLISIAKRGYTIKIGKPLFQEDTYNNRYVGNVQTCDPVANYLSNGRYSLMITSDGDGFSRYDDRMLYRWRPDLYANTGHYIYIKDMGQGKLWSTTYHPTRTEPEEYQVVFCPYKAEFKRRDGCISTHMIVSLDADHNFEVRKVTLKNQGNEEKQLEVTSYLELVDDTHLAEASHPAFNKLFLESEYLKDQEIFLAHRRRREEVDYPYVLHLVRSGTRLCRGVEYEQDRKRFIGRNHTLRDPDSVVNSIGFSNQAGFCNDPIMSLRAELKLGAGETATVTFITGVCQSREEAQKIAGELNLGYRIDDILEKFRLQKELELKYLEISRTQLNAFQNLISPIYYSCKTYRGPLENIRRNSKDQRFLWKFGVSGDNPIMLLKVKSIGEERVIRDVLKAYEYLRISRVTVDLIILIDSREGYLQDVDELINDMTSSLRISDSGSGRPSFFTIYTDRMLPAELDLLYTVARVVFSEGTGIYFANMKENYELPEEY